MLSLVLRCLGDHDLGGQQQTRDRSRVLQCQTSDLGRVQDACFDQVTELARGRVVAVAALAGPNIVQDDSGIFTGVLDDLTQRLLDRARQDADADRLVLIRALRACRAP